MKLSEQAERYYAQAFGQKMTKIDRLFQPELKRAQNFGPRGGAMGQAIGNLIVERWRKLVQARIESWLEAYEQDEKTLEETDVDEFVSKLNSAIAQIRASLMSHTGRSGGTSTQFTFQIEQVNRQAGQKLLFEVTKAELKQGQKKMKKRKKTGLNITGPVIGSSIQYEGTKNKADVSIVLNTQFNQTINELRQKFEGTKELDKADRAEALKRIDKLIVLANREESPKRLQKVKYLFDTLAGMATKTKELILTVAPLTQEAKEHWPTHWPNIQW